MDPITGVGLVATTFTLIGVSVKVVKALDSLNDKWDQATMKIVSLRAQIVTLNSAFNELHQWMEQRKMAEKSVGRVHSKTLRVH